MNQLERLKLNRKLEAAKEMRDQFDSIYGKEAAKGLYSCRLWDEAIKDENDTTINNQNISSAVGRTSP